AGRARRELGRFRTDRRDPRGADRITEEAVSPTGLFQRHRAAIYLGAVLLVAAGVNALRTLPSGAYPEAVFPRIVVLALGSGFEPRDMIVAVTRPLEEALSGVIDLRRIRSRTVRGSAE